MKKRKQLLLIIMIVALMISSGLSGCGRKLQNINGEAIEFNSDDYILMDGPSESEHSTDSKRVEEMDSEELASFTQQVIWNKRMNQFKRANANTSIIRDGEVKNILLIGQDRRAGDKSEMRSDSMMIFSINTITNEINLVSLMRDMYIPCADGKEGMINMTYLNGQAPLLEETIEMDFGIHIDNYVEVDFWEFMNLYDTIGLLDVEMSAQEAEYANEMVKNGRFAHYDYGDEKPVWTMAAGVNSLDPEELLAFCRMRKNIGGDWGRTERQRRTITATYNKIMNMSTAGLIRLVKDCHPFFTTDMTTEDMLGYLYMLKKNKFSTINGYLIPVDGSYTQEVREETLSVLIPNIDQNRQAIQNYIYGNADIAN